jgi:hypothetical protein
MDLGVFVYQNLEYNYGFKVSFLDFSEINDMLNDKQKSLSDVRSAYLRQWKEMIEDRENHYVDDEVFKF